MSGQYCEFELVILAMANLHVRFVVDFQLKHITLAIQCSAVCSDNYSTEPSARRILDSYTQPNTLFNSVGGWANARLQVCDNPPTGV